MLGVARKGCLSLLQNTRVRKELISKLHENDTVNEALLDNEINVCTGTTFKSYCLLYSYTRENLSNAEKVTTVTKTV